VSAVSYAIGTPRAATLHGDDCRARDLTLARNVHGLHRFATTTDCRISNGLLRLTVGASGAAPSLTVEAWRGSVTVGDVYVDTYADLYGGTGTTAAWFSLGTLTIDSPAVSALLTAVRIERVEEPVGQSVTIRLVSALIGDAFVTLTRGERMFHVHHGDTRSPVTTTRRIRWTASPSPTGAASSNLVQETTPPTEGFFRFVASIDPTTASAGAFSLTTASVASARLGAGVGTYAARDGADDMRIQLEDTSRKVLVLV